jgi:hypothetical protein
VAVRRSAGAEFFSSEEPGREASWRQKWLGSGHSSNSKLSLDPLHCDEAIESDVPAVNLEDNVESITENGADHQSHA